jgi:hypothetical protein
MEASDFAEEARLCQFVVARRMCCECRVVVLQCLFATASWGKQVGYALSDDKTLGLALT